MNRTAILAILVMLGAAMAGCLGDDDVDSDDTTNDETVDTNGDNETAEADNETTEPGVNTAPTGALSADLLTGDAPLLVTFNITGEDADGDALSWTLDADGDGTADAEGDAVPSEYAHNFTAAGNYTAILNLTDGTDSFEERLNITVAEAGPPPTVPEDKSFGGTVQAGVDNPADGSDVLGVGEPDLVYNFTDNRSVVSKMTLTLEVSETGIITELRLLAPGEDEPVAVSTDGVITIDDPALLQEPGDWTAQVRVGLGARVDYTLTVTFE